MEQVPRSDLRSDELAGTGRRPPDPGDPHDISFGSPPGQSPPPALAGPPEDEEEQRTGLSPRAQRISALLTQLATTARSFLFYDPRNAAIHHFLTSLLESFATALEADGAIVLNVQPFELWYEGEVVYRHLDRERSLAFRLYRDGVRALTFQPGFHWEELARLLEILSIRYTGVHQHEDDMVTLLWRANFKHLDIVAVEGFVPQDDEAEPLDRVPGVGAPQAVTRGPGAADEQVLPDHVDLPGPSLSPPTAPRWLEVPVEALEALRSEVAASALPGQCLALMERLREALQDLDHRLQFGEVVHLFTEIRDFLLADEDRRPLCQLVHLLRRMAAEPPPSWDMGRKSAILELLRSCGDHRAVQRMLHSIPSEERALRPELIEVLDLVCPDPIEAVIEALQQQQGTAAHAVGRQLLEHFGAGRLELLIQRFATASSHVASDLVRVIAQIGGEQATLFVAQQCLHPVAEVQEEALRQLERLPCMGSVGRVLFDVFRRAEPVNQGKLLGIIARTGDVRFVDPLMRHVEGHATQLSLELARDIGHVVGRLGGSECLPRWREWLKPVGIFRKALPGPPARQVCAACALAELPGEEAAQLLRAALVLAEAECHQQIGRALAHHSSLKRRSTP